MLKLILKHLRYYWRTSISLLLIISIIIISVSYTSQNTEQLKIMASEELYQNWRTGYDLLISPGEKSDSDSALIRKMSYSQLKGGISIEQYEAIQSMEEIMVAAPLSFIGNVSADTFSVSYPYDEGFYLFQETEKVFDGRDYRTILQSNHINQMVSEDEMAELMPILPTIFDKGGWFPTPRVSSGYKNGYTYTLIGIDPEAEQQLLHLNDATIEGNYLSSQEELKKSNGATILPILIANRFYETEKTIETFLIDTSGMDVEEIIAKGGKDYLLTLPMVKLDETVLNPYNKSLITSFANYTLEEINNKDYGTSMLGVFPEGRDLLNFSDIQYEEIPELDGILTYKAIPTSILGEQINYRHQERDKLNKTFAFDIQGIFDPLLLENEFTSSTVEKSSEFYNENEIFINYDTNGNKIEPFLYESSPYKSGYYTGGADAVTSIKGAEFLLGENPISVIRVVLNGISDRSEENMNKIEKIASRIQDETGLRVDIMVGASDEKVNVLLDDYEGVSGYGVLTEPWTKEAGSFVIEDRVTTTNLLLGVFIIFLGAVSILFLFWNKRLLSEEKLTVLKTLGWSKNRLMQFLILEILIISVIAFGSGLMVTRIAKIESTVSPEVISMLVILYTFIVGLITYVYPISKSKKNSKNQRNRKFIKLKGLISLPIIHIVKMPMISIVKIGVIGFTLLFTLLFMSVINSTSSFLYVSMLGDSIDKAISPLQWTIFTVGILLCIFNLFSIQLGQWEQNSKELQIYKSFGWKYNKTFTLYFIGEAVICFIGIGVGLLMGSLVLNIVTSLNMEILLIILLSTLVVYLSVFTIGYKLVSSRNMLREF